jgi:hypothetical protein
MDAVMGMSAPINGDRKPELKAKEPLPRYRTVARDRSPICISSSQFTGGNPGQAAENMSGMFLENAPKLLESNR